MAEAATAENVQVNELDLTNLIEDLDERVNGQTPMKEAKTDYDAICKRQNENRGYNKKALNILTGLRKMSDDKFQDAIRTLQPALDMLIEHRSQIDTPDFLDSNVTSIT